ncbi:MAG: hypothetical protein HFG33_05200 [Bacilli bacterium]|nr:hypothetical protein [Bacilli bacterium]
MSSTVKLLCLTYVLLAVAILIVVLILVNKHNKKRYGEILDTLEREKNLILNANILSELSKVESMINSKDIENKYKEWKRRFEQIKNTDVPVLTDHLIEIEDLFKTHRYKEIEPTLAKVELSIYHVKTKANYLLEEIRNLTLSEERNRETVTKLKGKYRNIINTYHESADNYRIVRKPIELQFETIDKLFSAFEVAMEKNSFGEVAKIIKALDDSINNLDIVIDEAPEIILLGVKLLPKKMSDIGSIYGKMIKEGYNLDYLAIEYNINEAEKKIADVFDRLNVLNLEDSSLELKTMSTYFDSIYNDFDKEKLAKKSFTELGNQLATKTTKMAKMASNLTSKLGEIKDNYSLSDEDLKGLNIIEVSIKGIMEDYDMIIDQAKKKKHAFSRLNKDMQQLNVRLIKEEDKLDSVLKIINECRQDETRAYDQLDEIKSLLASSKEKINSYKLPLVPKKYYVELSEATEAVNDMIKELDKRPLDVETLNTRVDTARDLTLKLYKTTNEIVKTASMSEHAIVYGNRYRSTNPRVHEGLKNAENQFFRGCFKASLEDAINAINIVEPGIHERLLRESKIDYNKNS